MEFVGWSTFKVETFSFQSNQSTWERYIEINSVLEFNTFFKINLSFVCSTKRYEIFNSFYDFIVHYA